MRQAYCNECAGEGIYFMGDPNDPLRGGECPHCDGRGYVEIPVIHIAVHHFSPAAGGHWQAMVTRRDDHPTLGPKGTGDDCLEALNEVLAQLEMRGRLPAEAQIGEAHP